MKSVNSHDFQTNVRTMSVKGMEFSNVELGLHDVSVPAVENSKANP